MGLTPRRRLEQHRGKRVQVDLFFPGFSLPTLHLPTIPVVGKVTTKKTTTTTKPTAQSKPTSTHKAAQPTKSTTTSHSSKPTAASSPTSASVPQALLVSTPSTTVQPSLTPYGTTEVVYPTSYDDGGATPDASSSTSDSADSSNSPADKRLKPGQAAAAITVVVVLIVVGICALLVYLYRRRKRARQEQARGLTGSWRRLSQFEEPKPLPPVLDVSPEADPEKPTRRKTKSLPPVPHSESMRISYSHDSRPPSPGTPYPSSIGSHQDILGYSPRPPPPNVPLPPLPPVSYKPPRMAGRNPIIPRRASARIAPPVPATVVRAFTISRTDELRIKPGEPMSIISSYDDGWALCANGEGGEGFVPLQCLEVATSNPPSPSEDGHSPASLLAALNGGKEGLVSSGAVAPPPKAICLNDEPEEVLTRVDTDPSKDTPEHVGAYARWLRGGKKGEFNPMKRKSSLKGLRRAPKSLVANCISG